MTVASGVGSHPGDDQHAYDEALRIVLDLLGGDLPYLPEVPGRGAVADLTGRSLALLDSLGADLQPAGWRLTGSGGGVDHRRAVSLLAQDLDALEERTQDFTGSFKVQVAGPWTLAAMVERPRGDRVLADHGARRELAQSLAAGLTTHLADLRRRVPGASLVLQVDEPLLPAVLGGGVPTASGFSRHRSVDAPAAAALLEEVFSAAPADDVVVHCCAPEVPFVLLARAGDPGLSVDLAVLTPGEYDALAAAAERGRRVHLGVVPGLRPSPEPTASSVAQRAERFCDLAGIDPASLVLTPACGLAGADPAWARTALAVVRDGARALG
ncbi:methionine synthase [Nocardioides marmoribigeumensis]|uniref:Methionine synthase II (Cobalamin-independent) n=1 Tax=Nocardioides marmoribigeumensis TaxID=433649 RepID=A0ABU2BZ51_9ACTN|nr:methionine synthase [Nocardioides marmoribigeumensis]MDR7363686.1 methionine synthase II (cobalamin-independent) [Nocardioides marmoribigeumensis]